MTRLIIKQNFHFVTLYFSVWHWVRVRRLVVGREGCLLSFALTSVVSGVSVLQRSFSVDTEAEMVVARSTSHNVVHEDWGNMSVRIIYEPIYNDLYITPSSHRRLSPFLWPFFCCNHLWMLLGSKLALYDYVPILNTTFVFQVFFRLAEFTIKRILQPWQRYALPSLFLNVFLSVLSPQLGIVLYHLCIRVAPFLVFAFSLDMYALKWTLKTLNSPRETKGQQLNLTQMDVADAFC